MKKNKRDYQNSFPSVTQVLGVLRKIALEYWFKVNTLQFITEESNKGKTIGTQIHTAIQEYIETGTAKIDTEYAVEVSNALNSFILFSRENKDIKFKRSEIALTSQEHGFNGTIDCVALDGDKLIIGDWKTGKKSDKEKPPVYDEYLTQVAAYVYLYNENNSEKVNEAIIVPIAKDTVAYNTHRMDREQIDVCFNDCFLPALKIYNHQKRSKKWVSTK